MMIDAPAVPAPGGNYTCAGWNGINPLCRVGEGVDSAVDSASSSIVSSIASSVKQAEVDILTLMTKLWLNISPNTPKPPGCSNANITVINCPGPTGFVRAHTQWLVVYLAVLGLLIAAGRLAWERRTEPAREAAKAMLMLVLVTGCSTGLAYYCMSAGDAYSTWILDQASSAHGGGGFANQVNSSVNVTATGIADMLMVVIGLLGIFSSIMQIILMYVRSAMLGLIFGVLPIPAAVSNTAEGKMWLKKLLGWGGAFLLYKPTAATVYAYAFVAFKSNDTTDQLSGLVMIVLAVATLPALLRFVNPLTSSATGGGSGAGAAMAGAGVAMGARMVPNFRRAAGGPAAGGGGGADPSSSAPGGASGTAGGGRPSSPGGADPGGGGHDDGSSGASGADPTGGSGGSPPESVGDAASGASPGGPAGGASAGGPSGGGAAGGAAAGVAGAAVSAGHKVARAASAEVEGPDGSR